jgi:hypothetical protein
MPLQFSDLWEKVSVDKDIDAYEKAIYELGRFVECIKLYEDYAPTFVQKTSRSIIVRDSYDLRVYMMRNNSRDYELNDLVLRASDEYITKFSSQEIMLEKETNIMESFRDNVSICRFLWDQCKSRVNAINNFVHIFDKQLNEMVPFIQEDYNYAGIKPIDIFNRLSIDDQYEISTDLWKKILRNSRSTHYLIVVRMIFNCEIGHGEHIRHPYLVARRGDMIEVAKLICEKSGSDEPLMRILATNFAIVSKLDLPDLMRKCLLLKARL